MKKMITCILGVLFACLLFSLAACSDLTIEFIRTVGTFSGYRVDYVLFHYKDKDGQTTEVDYYVDDVYITTWGVSTYRYLVYTSETEYMFLEVAYEEGLITHDDLLAIAAIEQANRENTASVSWTETVETL